MPSQIAAGNGTSLGPTITAAQDGALTIVAGAAGSQVNAVNIAASGAITTLSGVDKLAGGSGGEIHYQSGPNATALLANGTSGQVLQANGGTAAPSWVTLSGVPAGTVIMTAMNIAPTGYLKCNGAAVSRTTYATLFAALVRSATVTMTIASPGVITWTSHGLSANDPVRFTTTGALPTGFVANTTYFVVGASITTNTFQLSATAGGAAINTSGTQSGVHTAIHAPFGVGDGSTTFNVPDLRGEFVRGWDDSRAVDSNRSFGAAQLDAFQGHKHQGLRTSFLNAGIAGGGNDTTSTSGTTDGSELATTFGTPRTATETRPRNVALMYCIKT